MLQTGPTCWPRATLASRKINHFRVLDHWYRLTLPQLRKSPEVGIRISRTSERSGSRSGALGDASAEAQGPRDIAPRWFSLPGNVQRRASTAPGLRSPLRRVVFRGPAKRRGIRQKWGLA